MESALMISPLNLAPISMANFDFPVPVAPRITTTGNRRKTDDMGAAIMVLTSFENCALLRDKIFNFHHVLSKVALS